MTGPLSPSVSSPVLPEELSASPVLLELDSELLPSESLDERSSVVELVELEPLEVLEVELVEVVLPGVDELVVEPAVVDPVVAVALELSDSEPTSSPSSPDMDPRTQVSARPSPARLP